MQSYGSFHLIIISFADKKNYFSDFVVHEALVLVLSFIILEKSFNRLGLEKTGVKLILRHTHRTDGKSVVTITVFFIPVQIFRIEFQVVGAAGVA